MSERTLEDIETKIAYLELANNELSDVVFRQSQEIRALIAKIESVEQRLRTAHPGDSLQSLDDERPPHY